MAPKNPMAAQQRPQSIKILFIPNHLPCQKSLVRTVCRPVIVAQRRLLRKIAHSHRLQRVPLRRFAVHDRRIGPLHHIGVPLPNRQHRLFQVPAVDVEHLIQLPFDHIFHRVDAKILLGRMHIDEPHIIIAVRRRKPPGPAAGFCGEQYFDIVARLDLVQILLNFL